jgi:hypothetical protein
MNGWGWTQAGFWWERLVVERMLWGNFKAASCPHRVALLVSLTVLLPPVGLGCLVAGVALVAWAMVSGFTGLRMTGCLESVPFVVVY